MRKLRSLENVLAGVRGFLPLHSHLTWVLKHLQGRTFEKSFSVAKTLQQAGGGDVCVQLSDGLKSPADMGRAVAIGFFFALPIE